MKNDGFWNYERGRQEAMKQFTERRKLLPVPLGYIAAGVTVIEDIPGDTENRPRVRVSFACGCQKVLSRRTLRDIKRDLKKAPDEPRICQNCKLSKILRERHQKRREEAEAAECLSRAAAIQAEGMHALATPDHREFVAMLKLLRPQRIFPHVW